MIKPKSIQDSQEALGCGRRLLENTALNGFPGGCMNNVANWLSSEDPLSLMEKNENGQIFLSENITYKDAETTKQISQRNMKELLSQTLEGWVTGIEIVVQSEGFNLCERHEQGGYSHELEDYAWNDFVKLIKKSGKINHFTSNQNFFNYS